jgi:prevent-host-death family protein
MITVGAYEAKTHLPRLLKRVRQGEPVTITKHGVPIARLVPVDDTSRPGLGETIDALRAWRRGHRLDGPTLAELVRDGRR